MMELINYYLKGFGFVNLKEFITSTFGFMLSSKVVTYTSIIGVLSSFLESYFGISLAVFTSFVFLNILEFITGVEASKKKGEKVESRKMGRMFLKVGTYIGIISMLHSFSIGIVMPEILGLKIQPFSALYWSFLSGVIYQLYKSLLENMEILGWKEIKGVLSIPIKYFKNIFDNERHKNK